jgi:hypothetical protein
MTENSIIIKGARQNNLNNTDDVIPRNKKEGKFNSFIFDRLHIYELRQS